MTAFRIIDFDPGHLAQINLQEQQRRNFDEMPPDWVHVLSTAGKAVSAIVGSEIIGSAGIVKVSATAGFLWGAISQDAGPHFIALHRAAARLLATSGLERIEAVTEVDFAAGRRWLELLGFEYLGYVPKDGLHGEDHFKYAWTSARSLN